MSFLQIANIASSSVDTPNAGQISIFADSLTGDALSWKDSAGQVFTLGAADGNGIFGAGNSGSFIPTGFVANMVDNLTLNGDLSVQASSGITYGIVGATDSAEIATAGGAIFNVSGANDAISLANNAGSSISVNAVAATAIQLLSANGNGLTINETADSVAINTVNNARFIVSDIDQTATMGSALGITMIFDDSDETATLQTAAGASITLDDGNENIIIAGANGGEFRIDDALETVGITSAGAVSSMVMDDTLGDYGGQTIYNSVLKTESLITTSVGAVNQPLYLTELVVGESISVKIKFIGTSDGALAATGGEITYLASYMAGGGSILLTDFSNMQQYGGFGTYSSNIDGLFEIGMSSPGGNVHWELYIETVRKTTL